MTDGSFDPKAHAAQAEKDKRAQVPPPPRRRGILQAVPSVAEETPPNNMQVSNTGTQDLNFKVDPEFHQVFKVVAAIKGMKMKDLLESCFAAWVEKYGDEQIRSLTTTLPPKG